MLNIVYPEIYLQMSEISKGLSVHLPGGKAILVVKASAKAIAATKLKKRIKFHFAPVTCGGIKTFCVISAYLDDEINPTLIWTPLYDEPLSQDLIEFLRREIVEVYMMDEKSRPWLSYAGVNVDNKKFNAFSNKIKLPPSALVNETHVSILKQASEWFNLTSIKDDRRSFDLVLTHSLFPEDFAILDATAQSKEYHGAVIRHSELMYSDAGARQEPDFAEQLTSIFSGDDIYLNPLKLPNKQELCDILVNGHFANYFFQLKASPNTETVINRRIDRSQATTLQHLEKALQQSQSCLDYLGTEAGFTFTLKTDRRFRKTLVQKSKTAIFIVVTQELFDKDWQLYSDKVIKFAQETGQVTIYLSETTFYDYVHYCKDEQDFFKLILCDFVYLNAYKSLFSQIPVKPRLEEVRQIPVEHFFKRLDV